MSVASRRLAACTRPYLFAAALIVFSALAIVATLSAAPSRASAQAAPGGLAWAGCGGAFECATLRVPVDYADPAGRSIDLALLRRPALDPTRRIGSLLVNPGGPGASGVDIARAFAFVLPAEVQQRFDIVGFDPRGVGRSSPLLCHDNIQRLAAIEPAPRSADQWREAQDGAQQFARLCAERGAGLLQHLGSQDVVQDMDRIRAALGEERLTYLGYSYGTLLGALYADRFPDRVRAMVLDGPVDPGTGAVDLAITQASGFDRAFTRFLDDCRTRGCALTRRGDPSAAVDDLLRQVRTQPVASRTADRPAGPGETFLALIAGMYRPTSWRTLERAIEAGLDGDGSALVNLADSLLGRRGGVYDNSNEMNSAVNCLDYAYPRDPEAYAALAAAAELRAPRFGRAFVAGGLGCAYWPSEPRPIPAIRAAGAPPLLIIATTHDPATPFEWGLAMRAQLQSGVLLTFDGDGHTAYASGNRCVNEVATRYLVSLTPPVDGAVCGTDPEPRPPAAREQAPARGLDGPDQQAAAQGIASGDTAAKATGWRLRSLAVAGGTIVLLALVAAVQRRVAGRRG